MSFPKKGIAVVILALTSRVAGAGEPGNLVGWVEDSRGLPVPNALISVFAKGMRDGGFVTFSDAGGRFAISSIPAGSYTLRAAGHGRIPARARQVTVLPNQDSFFAISLRALDGVTGGEASERVRELKWLERHRQRSVLEERDARAAEDSGDARPEETDLGMALAPWLSDLSGSVEVVADSSNLGATAAADVGPGMPGFPVGSGVVRLAGKIGDAARFKVGGLLAENGNRSWRMAGEFLVEPADGHHLRLGAGYGTVLLGTPATPSGLIEASGVGSAFVEDRWAVTHRLALTGGLRHSYVGFLSDQSYIDPLGSVEVAPTRTLRVRGSFRTTTLAPGGDLLTVSSLAVGPAIAYATVETGVRPQRTFQYELEVTQHLGATSVGARAFREDTRDQLLNVFTGAGAERSLRIVNDGGLQARGVEFQASRRFGNFLSGSMTYSYGRAAHDAIPGGAAVLAVGPGPLFPGADAAFHDVAGRIDAAFEKTDTRLVAYYRFNTLLNPEPGLAARHTTRFDVQLSQGLPFLGALTRADWDVLVAFRNLFYDGGDGAVLDEIAVASPPKRVLGGISVRF
jgi:TonB dependent receptor-like, beta-barrel/Carboxypeptidase regulatory-like domain